ncbi:hypothetical protein [Rhodoblastus sp.]|uniref:hypothetical protein n=1 Tax=Rhodoblastus sp. TaxID=1962975 RepID=UPI002633F157|nr:hypothetical protein [Rhodoblastus sp.]
MSGRPTVSVTEPTKRKHFGMLVPPLGLIVLAGLVARGVVQRRVAAATLAL